MPLKYQKKRARKGMKRRGMRRMQRRSGVKYSLPGVFKRVGQICRIANDPVLGSPTASAANNGNSSLFVGGTSTDTANTFQYGASMQFKLESVLDSNDFTNLYDRYKIVGVKLKFLYQSNLANSDSTTGTNALPLISYAFDGDDASLPTGYLDLARKQYTHQKILNGNRFFSYYIKPRITKEIFNSPITTGYSSERACWLDCNSAGIPHFGVKMWINNWNSGNTKFNQLTIQPTYYLAMKDTQ